MSNQILVPSLGESITEATVSKWLKQVGETVDTDEPIVELETDKVNLECPSPCSGILTSIKVKEGSIVEVGSLLGVINEEKSSSTKITKEENSQPKAKEKIISKRSKKNNLKRQEPLKLVDAVDEKNEKEETQPSQWILLVVGIETYPNVS